MRKNEWIKLKNYRFKRETVQQYGMDYYESGEDKYIYININGFQIICGSKEEAEWRLEMIDGIFLGQEE